MTSACPGATLGFVDIPRNGVAIGEDGLARCWWGSGDALYESYHDDEWGRPVRDDRRLFEMLILEGFQSGLSWLTILRKRENFRRAFKGFDPKAVARFASPTVDRLVQDAGIVRHRGKIESTINNAKRLLELVADQGSFARYVWSFEPDSRARKRKLDWPTLVAMGVADQAKAMSKDLKRRGWSFVGPTTVHSFMEAVGLVNDHVDACHLRAIVEKERGSFRRP
jgi:DNA-3-methyladenine glycosylase I